MKMFQFQLTRFKPFLVSNMFLLLQWKKIVTVTFFDFLILHTLIPEMCELTSVALEFLPSSLNAIHQASVKNVCICFKKLINLLEPDMVR